MSVVKPDPKCSQPTIEASARDDVLKKKPIKTGSETTRESVSNQVAIGLSFASDWLSWCCRFRPIMGCRKAKLEKFRIAFEFVRNVTLFKD